MKNYIVYVSNNEQYEIVSAAYSVNAASEKRAETLALSYSEKHQNFYKSITDDNVIEIAVLQEDSIEYVFEITQGYTE
jgi:hypothetical protein